MMRVLTTLTVQGAGRDPGNAVQELRAELPELLEDFPNTDLVFYPEYHVVRTTGGPDERRRQYEAMAEPLDGPRVTGLRDLARDLGVWLVPGTVIERGPEGQLFNTLPAISPDGEIAAAYRKIFPWRPFEPFDPGRELVVFEIQGVGKVGLCICYDLWFPEIIRNLAWLGAELILCPSATSTRDRAQELILAQANAIQNQVFVLNSNAAEPSGTGESILVDPQGTVVFKSPSESASVLTATVDLDQVTITRKYGTAAINRMWSQTRPGDPVVPLPLYEGELRPDRWNPESRR